MITVEFSMSEWNHLYYMMEGVQDRGEYSGNKEQYWKRHDRIMDKFQYALKSSIPTREPNPSPIPNQDPLDQKLDHLDYLDHLDTEELMKDTIPAITDHSRQGQLNRMNAVVERIQSGQPITVDWLRDQRIKEANRG